MDEENAFRLYTKEEADSRGIGYEPQVEIRCPHCGEPYEQQGFIGRAGRIAWVTHKKCQCEGAVAEREQARQAEAEAKRLESQRRLKRCGVPRRYMSAQISVPEAARYVVGFGSAGDKGLLRYCHAQRFPRRDSRPLRHREHEWSRALPKSGIPRD